MIFGLLNNRVAMFKFFYRPSFGLYLFMLFITLSAKIAVYAYYKLGFLYLHIGGGNDADYYHNYALGQDDFAANIWPEILFFLNSYDLYNRDLISGVLFFINLFLIPILVVNLSKFSSTRNNKLSLCIFFLVSVYPTLYFYTFDIYRDVFMVFCFLVGCLFVKKWIDSESFIIGIFWFLVVISWGVILFKFRPYLGLSFYIGLIFYNVHLNRRRLYLLILIYLFLLIVAHSLGFFEKLIIYRSGFAEINGGSTLGLDFSNLVTFIPNLFLSFTGQFLGLYMTNYISILLFIIETVPVLFMLIYIFKNISHSNKFLRFLLFFSIIYATIWLVGNDNLGTAVRLRIYNYLAIYICFFSILAKKQGGYGKV